MNRFLLVFLFATSACAKIKEKFGHEEACVGPPVQYSTGYLQVCQKSDEGFCCAYGVVTQSNELCYFVLCQLPNDCHSPWEYKTTICPQEAEESNFKGDSCYDADEDEYYWQETLYTPAGGIQSQSSLD